MESRSGAGRLPADHVEGPGEYGTVVVPPPRGGKLDQRGLLGERAVDRPSDGHVAHRRRYERDTESGCDKADERRRFRDLVGDGGREAVGGTGLLDGVVEDRPEMRGV